MQRETEKFEMNFALNIVTVLMAFSGKGQDHSETQYT
jgi:hypothetical protein